MNIRIFITVLAMGVLTAFVGGCSDIEKRSYEIAVKNDSEMPVTVWLTKDGPLYEKDWKSPEDLAIESRSADEMIAGVVIPPGHSASVGPIEGKFAPRASAILRVYLGKHNFSDLLAMSKGSPDRRDYELDPGFNGFQVVDRDGMLLVERSKEATKTSDSSR